MPERKSFHISSIKQSNKAISSFSITAKVIFMFFSTGRMERKLVLESSLLAGSWGLLELYILLIDDIVELDKIPDDLDVHVNRRLRNYTVAIDVQHKDLLIPLLIARCPVSRPKGI